MAPPPSHEQWNQDSLAGLVPATSCVDQHEPAIWKIHERGVSLADIEDGGAHGPAWLLGISQLKLRENDSGASAERNQKANAPPSGKKQSPASEAHDQSLGQAQRRHIASPSHAAEGLTRDQKCRAEALEKASRNFSHKRKEHCNESMNKGTWKENQLPDWE